MRNKKIIYRSIAIILIIITIIQLPTQVNTVLIPAIKDSPHLSALIGSILGFSILWIFIIGLILLFFKLTKKQKPKKYPDRFENNKKG